VEKATGKKIVQQDLAKVREELNRQIRIGTYKTPLGVISLDKEGEIHQENFYVARIKMDANGKTGKYVYVK
jgi:branched-chain amino acid transport system substrate-binding protein